MAQHVHRPGKKVVVAAVVALAATYGYFLIFAGFGFLNQVRAVLGETAGAGKPFMGTMGLAGILGSVLAAGIYTAERNRGLLAAGFVLCAGAAGLALLKGSVLFYHGVALLIGLGAGLTTVALASGLRQALGGMHLGKVIGLGTGLAYGLCSLPGVFAAGATTQTMLAMLAAGAGLVAAPVLTFAAPAERPAGFDYSGPGVLVWVLVFLALVSLDTAAFYVIQHTAALKENNWSGHWQLGTNAGLHLVAAFLTGCALDRGKPGRTMLVGTLALLAGCVLIDKSHHILSGGVLLYVAGVSVYSTVLVYYPAHSQRPWLAALVYAVAGWGGSAAGIGLAENRQTLPGWLGPLAGGVVLLGLTVRNILRRRRSVAGGRQARSCV